MEDNGLVVLNGNKGGDESGEYTYIGNGTVVIDYEVVDRETWSEIINSSLLIYIYIINYS